MLLIAVMLKDSNKKKRDLISLFFYSNGNDNNSPLVRLELLKNELSNSS